MARFRLLVIISAVWLTFVFNLERPDFLNIDLDSVTYVLAAVAALATLWLPDVSQRTEFVFIPTLVAYVILKLTVGTPILESSIQIIVLEVVVLYLTIALFRRISNALLSFEHTVDTVLLRPDMLNVLPMEEGTERLKQEISRARRFERQLGIILVSTDLPGVPTDFDPDHRFDLEEQLQKHYLQLRLAQVAELILYKVDLVMLHKDEVLICMPETTQEIVQRKAEELVEEVKWRLGMDAVYGVAMFPEDGFIERDLVDRATIRLYDAQDRYHDQHHDDDDRYDGDAGDDSTAPAREPSSADGQVDYLTRNGSSSAALFRALNEIFHPWPDVILNFQRSEAYLSRQFDERSDLFNPTSWLGLLPYQSVASRRLYVFLKRFIDLFLVLIALPFALPLMGLIALLIWLEDRGPIFFVQQRTGLGGHRFPMYKFRTMVPNAEEKLKELAEQGLAKLDKDGKLAEPLKLKRDPRITRVGRILRKTSLDELPQLFNVIRGDMSLVGPRPTSWGTDSYRLFHTERLQVRPGITGLWQVAARGTTNFDEWVDWDRTYVEKMCLSLDVQIFVRTFTSVFRQRGAR